MAEPRRGNAPPQQRWFSNRSAGLKLYRVLAGLLALCRAGPVLAETSIDRLLEICAEGTARELEAALAAGTKAGELLSSNPAEPLEHHHRRGGAWPLRGEVNAVGRRHCRDCSPLAEAILSGREAAAKTAILLKAGADPDFVVPDSYGSMAPLSLAAYRGQVSVVKMLLEAGAKINVGKEWQQTPLIAACVNFPGTDRTEEDRRQIIRLLLDGGADLEFNESGATGLVWAGADAKPETIRLLLDAGIPVDACDASRTTALMTAAASNSNPETVALLLEKGADPKLRSREGCTALDYARGIGSLLPGGNETPAAGTIIALLEEAAGPGPD